jgi:hypothetical protein
MMAAAIAPPASVEGDHDADQAAARDEVFSGPILGKRTVPVRMTPIAEAGLTRRAEP